MFVINQGDSLGDISSRLQKQGYIKSEFVFKANTYLLGLHSKLRAGSFSLPPHLDNWQLANFLSKGGSNDIWIQLLEGWRNEEIANYLEDNSIYSGKSFQYLAKDKSGQIFPDTYSIPKDKDVEFFINETIANFQDKLSKASDAPTITLAFQNALVIASLLEREANNLEAMRQISGIIQNRLDINMALQIDATVQYAKDSLYPPKKYWQPINRTDLTIDHPANTYLYPGLPPEPICNPGFNALYAAFHPIESNYLYYITGTDGQMYYAVTLDDHNQNIAKYLN